MDSQTLARLTPVRRVLWCCKLMLACYAVSFAAFMLAGVVSLPFVGTAVLDWWFQTNGRVAMLLLAVAVSPFVYRRLK